MENENVKDLIRMVMSDISTEFIKTQSIDTANDCSIKNVYIILIKILLLLRDSNNDNKIEKIDELIELVKTKSDEDDKIFNKKVSSLEKTNNDLKKDVKTLIMSL